MERTLIQTSPKHQTQVSRLLKSCTRTSELHQIHTHMIKTGLDLIAFPVSKLLAASVLVNISYSCSIFARIKNPNLFMYSTMLRGYSISQEPAGIEATVSLLNSMKARGISLDQFSLISTLKTCARKLALQTGRQIHASLLRSGLQVYINLRNTLLHFYCVCGRIGDAQYLFDENPHIRDAISWNSLMGGYIQISQLENVIGLFREMQMNGFEISAAAIITALSASVDVHCRGESLHGYCIKIGFSSDLNVVTAITTMYAKSRCMGSARRMFDDVLWKDVVLYNCMVDGYAKGGLIEESLALLQQMKHEGMKPNAATLVGLLSACASSGSLVVGRRIHEYVNEEISELDTVLGTAFIDMYSKCGYLEAAFEIFSSMPSKDVKSWTAMITGFGNHGQAEAALQLFYKMEEEFMEPNEVTFLAVLSACRHEGLVEEGKECLERMIRDYRFSPKIEHYGCVIDLLGRAGLLEEAHELIMSLPFKGDAMVWRALLAACRLHGNVELGELAKRVLMELGDEHPTDLILLSGTYAFAGRWADVVGMKDFEVEKSMNKKEAGRSSIEMGG